MTDPIWTTDEHGNQHPIYPPGDQVPVPVPVPVPAPVTPEPLNVEKLDAEIRPRAPSMWAMVDRVNECADALEQAVARVRAQVDELRKLNEEAHVHMDVMAGEPR